MRLSPPPPPMARALLGILAAAPAVAAAPPPSVEAPAAVAHRPLRTLVRIVEPDDRELFVRLLGQTVDLDVELVAADGASGSPTLGGELREAGELAARQAARVVVWLRSRGGRRKVYVAEPGTQRVFVRSLQTAGGEGSRSAALEEAAVVVRSALQALSQGDAIGIENAAAEAEEKPAPPPPPPSTLGFTFALGWQLAFDGTDGAPPGATGPALRLGLLRGRLAAGLLLAGGLPATLSDAYSTVRLSRQEALVELLWAPVTAGRVRLLVGAAAGLALFYRSTDSVQPGFVAQPGQLTPAFVGGPTAQLLVRPSLARRLWLGLDVAAEALAGAPELGYGVGSGFVSRNRLWPVAPRVGLLLAFRSR